MVAFFGVASASGSNVPVQHVAILDANYGLLSGLARAVGLPWW